MVSSNNKNVVNVMWMWVGAYLGLGTFLEYFQTGMTRLGLTRLQ